MKLVLFAAAAAAAAATAARAEVLFREDFGDGWRERWVDSTSKGDEAGKVDVSAGKWYGDAAEDAGLQTTQDARFYQVSAAIEKPFSNKGKTLVLQYSVKHEQNIDCGGGYVKLLPAGLDQASFNGDSDYNVMFGPDICGATKKVHVIFNYNGKNHLIKKEIACESDDKSHLYTLVVRPDNTYEVRVDNDKKESGSLEDDWDMLPPKKINDPNESKPDDWDDRVQVPDPDDKKPDDWDDIAAEIPDPDAEQPDDWDEELDGDWQAPMIDNPEYKGEWEPKMIDNPAYKGAWEHPQIDNPDYEPNDSLYAYDSHAFVGFEIWQVKSGTIFDRILVTDDVAEAEAEAEKFLESQKKEKEMYDRIKDEERKKEEEERKALEDAEEADEAAAEADEAEAADADADADADAAGKDEL